VSQLKATNFVQKKQHADQKVTNHACCAAHRRRGAVPAGHAGSTERIPFRRSGNARARLMQGVPGAAASDDLAGAVWAPRKVPPAAFIVISGVTFYHHQRLWGDARRSPCTLALRQPRKTKS
jgi:hypothetical protein